MSIIPIGIKGLFVKGIEGCRRLPFSCHLGDWTHAEWFGKHVTQFTVPPDAIKVIAPGQFPKNRKPDAKSESVKTWTFQVFYLYQNGSPYAFYRRTR